MSKKYEIQIINWQWQITKTSCRKADGDRFWFAREGNDHPRIKTFKTMKAAREWLVANSFVPVFKSAKRPCTFRSPMGGMEARIVVKDDQWGFFPAGSTEGKMAKRARKVWY